MVFLSYPAYVMSSWMTELYRSVPLSVIVAMKPWSCKEDGQLTQRKQWNSHSHAIDKLQLGLPSPLASDVLMILSLFTVLRNILWKVTCWETLLKCDQIIHTDINVMNSKGLSAPKELTYFIWIKDIEHQMPHCEKMFFSNNCPLV